MTSDRGNSGGAELELTPVTPKSPGLNPNASVFNCKLSASDGGDTSQWEQNDSGIANNSADYSYANGDLSGEKSDIGVFSPSSDATFQTEFVPFSSSQEFSDSNANVAVLEDPMGSMVLEGQTASTGAGYPGPTDTQSGFTGALESGGEAVPMTGIQYSNDTSVTETEMLPGDSSQLSDDQLRQVLKHQLETYFSRENLSSDSYLQSQMDADQYVPITTVSSLDQIQRLTSDLQLIVELLRESNFVQVDEKGEKVRPNHNRCIVILREIPDTTPVQDVQNLFSGENCPKFVGCEFAHNSNWYVTFDSDADAQRAYQYLREEVRTFLGKPIMARIKAKPLLRTYRPQNGYMNKRFQQPVSVAQQPTPGGEVVTSSAAQPQFTATQPFIMPNVSQYHLNGQQAMPFYPPPSPHPLLPTWQTSPHLLDPSMVLAMNGYQATNVKVNQGVSNRTSYQNVNRNNNNTNNTRNQKMHHGGHSNLPSNRDNRINTNESLPPRLQHQHDRHQQNAVNNMHKTTQRNMDAPISNHMSSYQNRRMDGSGPHPSHHGNHGGGGHHGGHSGPHMGHTGPHYHSPHHPHHLDHNANSHGGHPAGMGGRMSQNVEPMQQRFPKYDMTKSYKSRRKRDDDGVTRPSQRSSAPPQAPQREPGSGPGVTNTSHPRQAHSSEKFDYEPTSFPPLPGSMSNQASGEVFESKLSDVVKGTAKPQVKDTPVSKPVTPPAAIVSTATTTMPTTSTPKLAPVSSMSAPAGREMRENRDGNANLPASQNGAAPNGTSSHQSSSSRDGVITKSSGGTASGQQQQQQPQHPALLAASRPTSKPQETLVPEKSTENKSAPSLQSQSNMQEEKTASVSAASSVKLSYAQMVQRSKTAEASASALAEKSDGSDSDATETPTTSSSRASHTLKEQGQTTMAQSGGGGGKGCVVRSSGGKDFTRKDSRDGEGGDHRRGEVENKRDDYRKENDGYRREEPREQRLNNSRRMKENRERRFDRDRDAPRRPDRRDRDGPSREKDGARMTAVAK